MRAIEKEKFQRLQNRVVELSGEIETIFESIQQMASLQVVLELRT